MEKNVPPIATDLGIPIGAEQFNALVTHYLGRMEAGDEMTAEDYVKMTRLWNTLLFGKPCAKDDLFGRYAAAFFPAYVERVSKSLNAQPTKGMALYSKEHDIYLGGTPHPGSQYKLEHEH